MTEGFSRWEDVFARFSTDFSKSLIGPAVSAGAAALPVKPIKG